MQFLLPYLPSRSDSEVMYFKPSLVFACHLLRSEHQITMSTMIAPFTEPGDIEYLICRPFIICTASSLIHLNVHSTQTEYHRQFPIDYVYSITFLQENCTN